MTQKPNFSKLAQWRQWLVKVGVSSTHPYTPSLSFPRLPFLFSLLLSLSSFASFSTPSLATKYGSRILHRKLSLSYTPEGAFWLILDTFGTTQLLTIISLLRTRWQMRIKRPYLQLHPWPNRLPIKVWFSKMWKLLLNVFQFLSQCIALSWEILTFDGTGK